VSFITGGNSDRGNFVVGVEHTEQDDVFLAAFDQVRLNSSVTVYDPVGFKQFGFSGDPWSDGDGNGIADYASLGSSRIPYGYFDFRNAGLGATGPFAEIRQPAVLLSPTTAAALPPLVTSLV
jgi:hypothetical protein